MPDDSWNPKGLDIPLRRPIDLFVPNVCAIDMDTTGTWPFGRRLEDQVATRFLSLFLDMEATLNGKPYHIELLNDQALWDQAPIVPKTPAEPARERQGVPHRVPLPRRAACRRLAPYERDVEAVERDLAALAEEPPSAARAAGIASRLYRRATLTGAIDQLGAPRQWPTTGCASSGPGPTSRS